MEPAGADTDDDAQRKAENWPNDESIVVVGRVIVRCREPTVFRLDGMQFVTRCREHARERS